MVGWVGDTMRERERERDKIRRKKKTNNDELKEKQVRNDN